MVGSSIVSSRRHIFVFFAMVLVASGLLFGAAEPAEAAGSDSSGLPSKPAPAAAGDSSGFPSNNYRRMNINISPTDQDSAGVALSGWFAGLVFQDTTSGPQILWELSLDNYVGPGGFRYSQYRNKANGQCLSHSGGLLVTEPCSWVKYSQWWGFDHIDDYPCLPACASWDIIFPWDDSGKAVTLNQGLLELTPRGGHFGVIEQRRFRWVV